MQTLIFLRLQMAFSYVKTSYFSIHTQNIYFPQCCKCRHFYSFLCPSSITLTKVSTIDIDSGSVLASRVHVHAFTVYAEIMEMVKTSFRVHFL